MSTIALSTAPIAYAFSRSTVQPRQPCVDSPYRRSTVCRTAANGRPSSSPVNTTSSPPSTASASQWPPNGRPASATSRAPTGVNPSASATSRPSPIAPYVLGRSAAWNARPRSTPSAGRLCSAASWSARGAAGGCHGTRTAATTSTATISTPSVIAAHSRGVMPVPLLPPDHVPPSYAVPPGGADPRPGAGHDAAGPDRIPSRHAAPAPRTDHPQPRPRLLAAEHGHLEPHVGQDLQGAPLGALRLGARRGDHGRRCLAEQHADDAPATRPAPD